MALVKQMTSGKPIKLILAFCLPLIIGNICQQFYNMADAVIVGKFVGKGALAAVGSTGSLNFLVIGFALGICSGFCIPISQFFGANDRKQMRKAVANSVYLMFAVSLVLTVLTYFTTEWMLRIMQTPADIFEDAKTYILILFLGTTTIMIYNLLAGMLRAVGNSKVPLYCLIAAAVINIGLDILFVVVFKMGVAGAAIATLAAQLVSGLLCFLYIVKKLPMLHPEKDDWKPDLKMCGRLLYVGLPMGFQFSITAIGTIVLQSAINSLGSDTVAAVTAANKIQSIVTTPMETLGITMATYCGQNLGAARIDRIKKGIRQCSVVMVAYCLFAFALMATLGGYIAYLFIDPAETAILAQIKKYLTINGMFYIPLGLIFMYRNSIQGLEYAIPAMAAGVFELVARAAGALLGVPLFGFTAVCYTSPIAWVAADILLIPVYYYEIKKLEKKFAPPKTEIRADS